MIDIRLNDAEQLNLLNHCMNTLAAADKLKLNALKRPFLITALVDGIGLACPLPLLKTKIALRAMAADESVYVLATDPNSQLDLDAYCRQAGLTIRLSTQSKLTSEDTLDNRLEKIDTIFHVIITKTNGN